MLDDFAIVALDVDVEDEDGVEPVVVVLEVEPVVVVVLLEVEEDWLSLIKIAPSAGTSTMGDWTAFPLL